MNRRCLLAALLVVLFTAQVALANDLAGSWSGTLSAGGYEVPASVRFTDSGFDISAAGISSSGSYKLSGKKITLSPSSPPGFSSSTMSISLKGNRCTIKGSVLGIQGTLSLKRKGGSVQQKKASATAKPKAADRPALEIAAQLDLAQLAGRWTLIQEDRTWTLCVYADGWAALYPGDAKVIEGNPAVPLIYGPAELADGLLTIRREAEDPDAPDAVPLSELLGDEEPAEAPAAVSLRIEMDPDGQLLFAEGEDKLPFTFDGDTVDDYEVHPDSFEGQ